MANQGEHLPRFARRVVVDEDVTATRVSDLRPVLAEVAGGGRRAFRFQVRELPQTLAVTAGDVRVRWRFFFLIVLRGVTRVSRQPPTTSGHATRRMGPASSTACSTTRSSMPTACA